MLLSENLQLFSEFFSAFPKSSQVLNTLKKKMGLRGYLFWNNWLQKGDLLKCPKSLMSEHLWTVKMLKCPKGCLNMHDSIFIIFFDHSEKKSPQKIIF